MTFEREWWEILKIYFICGFVKNIPYFHKTTYYFVITCFFMFVNVSSFVNVMATLKQKFNNFYTFICFRKVTFWGHFISLWKQKWFLECIFLHWYVQPLEKLSSFSDFKRQNRYKMCTFDSGIKALFQMILSVCNCTLPFAFLMWTPYLKFINFLLCYILLLHLVCAESKSTLNHETKHKLQFVKKVDCIHVGHFVNRFKLEQNIWAQGIE